MGYPGRLMVRGTTSLYEVRRSVRGRYNHSLSFWVAQPNLVLEGRAPVVSPVEGRSAWAAWTWMFIAACMCLLSFHSTVVRHRSVNGRARKDDPAATVDAMEHGAPFIEDYPLTQRSMIPSTIHPPHPRL